MALIKCPECGKEISDKAKTCIYCGYPLQSNICKINGLEYDLSEFYERIMQHKRNGGENDIFDNIIYKAIFNDMYKLTHLVRSAYLCDMIYNDEKTPEIFTGEILEPVSSAIHCPFCQSADVKKLSFTKKATSIVGLGILSNKIGKTYQCNNCKATW